MRAWIWAGMGRSGPGQARHVARCGAATSSSGFQPGLGAPARSSMDQGSVAHCQWVGPRGPCPQVWWRGTRPRFWLTVDSQRWNPASSGTGSVVRVYGPVLYDLGPGQRFRVDPTLGAHLAAPGFTWTESK